MFHHAYSEIFECVVHTLWFERSVVTVFSHFNSSLRGRRSKGKRKGIRARDHACPSRARIPPPPSPSPFNACYAGYFNRYWYPYQAVQKWFYCLAQRWLSSQYYSHCQRTERSCIHKISQWDVFKWVTIHVILYFLTLHEIEFVFISVIPNFIKRNYSGALLHTKCEQRSLLYYRKWKPMDARKLVFTWPYVHPYL